MSKFLASLVAGLIAFSANAAWINGEYIDPSEEYTDAATGGIGDAVTALQSDAAALAVRLSRQALVDLDLALADDEAALLGLTISDSFNTQGLTVDDDASSGEEFYTGFYQWNLSTPLPTPQAHWKFDETTGTTWSDEQAAQALTTADDASGVSDASGKVDGSYRNDNNKGCYSGFRNPASTGSFSLWVKPHEASGTTGSFAGNYDGAEVFDFGPTSGGTMRFGWTGGSGDSRVAIASNEGTTYWNGEWHHYCLTWESGSVSSKLYIDGSLYATDTTSVVTYYLGNSGYYFSVGCRGRNGTTYNANGLDASYDEGRLWTNVLTAAQVLTEYQRVLPSAGGLLSLESELYVFSSTGGAASVVVHIDDGGTAITDGLTTWLSDDNWASSNSIEMTERSTGPVVAGGTVYRYSGQGDYPGNGTNRSWKLVSSNTNNSGKVQGWAVGGQ